MQNINNKMRSRECQTLNILYGVMNKMNWRFITPRGLFIMARTVKAVIYGRHGIGKTSLLQTLPQDTTLVINAEAGLNSVPGWEEKDGVITTRKWAKARAIAACLTPPDPQAMQGKPYSIEFKNTMLPAAKTDTGKQVTVDGYTDIFVDSITELSRICRKWAEQQPDCYTSNGKLDNRKVYGLVADEMLAFFRQLQFAPMNVWFVGALDKTTDDLGCVSYVPAMEGSKTPNRLIGIVDDVVCYDIHEFKKGEETIKRRVFVTHAENPWGYPSKTRSGLNMLEPAHLGYLTEKIQNAPVERTLEFDTSDIVMDEIIY